MTFLELDIGDYFIKSYCGSINFHQKASDNFANIVFLDKDSKIIKNHRTYLMNWDDIVYKVIV